MELVSCARTSKVGLRRFISQYHRIQIGFVSSSVCSGGHGRSFVISNHVKLLFVQYFDEVYVVLPLEVSCKCRLHETSPYLGLWEALWSSK